MSSDEAEKDVELLVEVDDRVVLLEIFGRGGVTLDLLFLVFGTNKDWSFEGQTSQIFDRLGLSGREQESLTRLGKVSQDGVERSGKAHVENSIGLIEDYIRPGIHKYARHGRQPRELPV